MNLSSTSGSRLPIFFSIDSKVFVAAIRSYPMWEVRSFNYLWYTIQFSHFSHIRQCSHIRKMSCAEGYFISREKKHAGVYENWYSIESFVSVILRMFVYFHYDNQQICSHFLPFPIIPGSQYRWNKTWKKYI